MSSPKPQLWRQQPPEEEAQLLLVRLVLQRLRTTLFFYRSHTPPIGQRSRDAMTIKWHTQTTYRLSTMACVRLVFVVVVWPQRKIHGAPSCDKTNSSTFLFQADTNTKPSSTHLVMFQGELELTNTNKCSNSLSPDVVVVVVVVISSKQAPISSVLVLVGGLP